MKIAGIVAEYNPFHHGHAWHIERTRAEDGGGATHIVAVMSGNFVQRGEPALLPKADRVRMALAGGVDLVLELPVPWAAASAEAFARGAVSLLDALGCVDLLSFGSECGDVKALERVADALESDRFPGLLRYHMDYGRSFPEARQRAVGELAGIRAASLLESANNTLGIEYIKALRLLGSAMRPYTVGRFGAGHDAELPVGEFASASAVRKLARAGRLDSAASYLPHASRRVMAEAFQAGRGPASPALAERAVLAALRRMTKEDMAALPGVSEGLENRLYDASRMAGSLEELERAVKTRRYPMTRVRRLIWAGFLGLPGGLEKERPPYLRVLGANERGMEIFRAAKGAALPVVSRVSRFETLDEPARHVFALECRAADLYGLTLPRPTPCNREYTQKLVKYSTEEPEESASAGDVFSAAVRPFEKKGASGDDWED